MSDSCFPRTKDIPKQSPLFWVTHKDRYLRQLLIRDIQEETGRDLIVYFTDTDRTEAQIDPGDDQYLIEVLNARRRGPTDLLLETNGGFTDPTEKICALFRQLAPDLRVIVPRRAKSNGTVIALCGSAILMSASSELGPIDPHLGGTPITFLLNAAPDPLTRQVAETFQQQTTKLATQLLKDGMLREKSAEEVEAVVQKLATRQHYHSHGSVIDAGEAASLGLKINAFEAGDPLWQKIWLLRTMYSYDCARNGHSKVFEGEVVSSAVTLQRAP
ncbi:SDH family Clp fold serine proteinase [Luteibacter sp.]|uniref:SDH family Clp fold serine proteinase n=1 Tax=Luteibacter sp. TaxID=1886636 RepID=UPI003F7CEEA4